jgi:hypothetical protein
MIPTSQIENYSWSNIIEPKPFREYSSVLMRTFRNNPRKAETFLETPLQYSSLYEIARNVNDSVGISPEDYIKGLSGMIVASYFDSAIIQVSIPLAERARIKKKTGLAEREIWMYRKTPLGALLGDVTSYLCIEESSSDLTPNSSYKIFSVANSPGKRYAPLTTLMILAWLHENTREGETLTLKEFVDDYYEFEVEKFGRSSKEYRELYFSLSRSNLPRLAETGLVYYESKHPEDKMKVRLKRNEDPLDQTNIEKLSKVYVESSLARYKCYAKDITSCLREKSEPLTAEEISEITEISKENVYTVLSMLRKVDVVEVVEGRTLEEYSELGLTENGREFYERYIERWLNALGFEKATRNCGIKERALDNIVTPSSTEFLAMRREKIDPVVSGERREEFSRMCREAFLRHQHESGHMS